MPSLPFFGTLTHTISGRNVSQLSLSPNGLQALQLSSLLPHVCPMGLFWAVHYIHFLQKQLYVME